MNEYISSQSGTKHGSSFTKVVKILKELDSVGLHLGLHVFILLKSDCWGKDG